jgi:hypothetical protein
MTHEPSAKSSRWEFEPGRDPRVNDDADIRSLLTKNQKVSARLSSVVKSATINLRQGLSHGERAITGMLAKAFKTHRAILLLAERGYGEDAHGLARSLFELAVYAKVIAADESGEMAQRWIDFASAESYELLRMARTGRFPSLHEIDETMLHQPDEFAKIEQRARRIQLQWGFWRVRKSDGEWILDGHWSGTTGLRELAERVGWSEQYALTQTLASQEIHGTSASVAGYIRDLGDELVVDGSPSTEGVAVALLDAERYLSAVIESWAEIMEIPEQVRAELAIVVP